MISVYAFENYKDYVLQRLEQAPKKGRGQFSKMAVAARSYSSSMNQVFRGNKHLTPEQAASICEFLELTERETEYFLLLVHYSRAGTPKLRAILKKQLKEFREQETSLHQRLPATRKMRVEEQAIFYSSWIMSAVRMLSFIEEFQSVEAIAKRLDLPRSTVQEAAEFLLAQGLCIKKNGRLVPGPQHTHLESSSPFACRHHANWRIKAMERHPSMSSASELAYTAPMTLSLQDVPKVREVLAKATEEIRRIIDSSPSEAFFCVNMDWFEVRR